MKDLPSLLKLIDDASPRVREKVAMRLRILGPSVWHELEVQGLELSPETTKLLERIVPREDDTGGRLSLPNDWLTWLELPTDAARLEAALELLSAWQYGASSSDDDFSVRTPEVGEMLDELANAFRAHNGDSRDASELVRFLSDEWGFRGVSPEDYYEPLNSSLVYALVLRRGLPITLAAIYVLVAARLGIALWGCNFPGHFLVGAHEDNEEVFFDPFNGGYRFTPGEIATLRRASPEATGRPANAQEIIARVLRNMMTAYQNAGAIEEARFCVDLLSRLEAATNA